MYFYLISMYTLYVVGDPEPAKIIHNPEILNFTSAVINETFITSCHGYGNELPVIMWNKNGVQLTNDSRTNIAQGCASQNNTRQFITSTLTISGIRVEDTGDYLCIANNSNGTDVYLFTLKVFVPGKFS